MLVLLMPSVSPLLFKDPYQLEQNGLSHRQEATMKTQYPHLNQTHRGIVASSLLLLLMAAGGTSWWTWRASTSTPTSQSSISNPVEKAPVWQQEKEAPHSERVSLAPQGTIPPISANQPAPPATLHRQELQPKIYWLKVEGPQIRLLPQSVALNAAVTSEQALKEGMINLLSQPKTNHLDSAIPEGTRLLSLRVTSQGIYINLSREFSRGGGSSSMVHRVAQILYTATSLDPTAKVYLSVEGQLVDENHPLGGEGVMLRQPLTRQQFAEDFPLS